MPGYFQTTVYARLASAFKSNRSCVNLCLKGFIALKSMCISPLKINRDILLVETRYWVLWLLKATVFLFFEKLTLYHRTYSGYSKMLLPEKITSAHPYKHVNSPVIFYC